MMLLWLESCYASVDDFEDVAGEELSAFSVNNAPASCLAAWGVTGADFVVDGVVTFGEGDGCGVVL